MWLYETVELNNCNEVYGHLANMLRHIPDRYLTRKELSNMKDDLRYNDDQILLCSMKHAQIQTLITKINELIKSRDADPLVK